MVLLELNEFSPSLLEQAADELNARNLKRVLNFHHTKTTTDDKEERYGLDPWVQWVSIHTGTPSQTHKVKHLGDVPNLGTPQLWEALDQHGKSSGIWGAMNSAKGSAKNCQFFFPDPWTFSEQAFPAELNQLLAFPRLYSKNYIDLDKKEAVKALLQLALFCLRPNVALKLLPITPKLIACAAKNGLPNYLLFSLFDLVNSALFSLYYKKYKPDFCVLFLNSIAHLQHHKWTDSEKLSPEMKICFQLLDNTIGIILNTLGDESPLIIANAFSQYRSFDEEEYLYRQINPDRFLQTAGIRYKNLEQLMTNDAHVFFDSEEDMKFALRQLESARIDDQEVFHVEVDEAQKNKIFFQVKIWKGVDAQSVLDINGKRIRFFDEFERVTQRSGSHNPEGDIYSSSNLFPENIYNHDIYNVVLDYFGIKNNTTTA